jgi:putative copper resistance protein D
MFEVLASIRFVHYSAALLIFGASVFIFLLAPPALSAVLSRPAWRLGLALGVVLIVSAGGWLSFEAGMMGDGWNDVFRPDTIGAVLLDTDFGMAWQLHGALLLALLMGLAMRHSTVIWLTSALALASLGLIGHAAMQTGVVGWAHRANLALHLLCGGFWLGGLLPLLAALRLTETSLRADAIIALRRFSLAGHGAVALVVVTGVGNVLLILGTGSFNRLSTYQQLLAAKIVLVALMIGLALLNRYVLVPRLRREPDASRALVRNSLAELALGGGVVALVSFFGLLDPYA